MADPATTRVRETAEPMISVIGLYKAFGDKKVLNGVDLEIARGESLMLVGGSGAGNNPELRTSVRDGDFEGALENLGDAVGHIQQKPAPWLEKAQALLENLQIGVRFRDISQRIAQDEHVVKSCRRQGSLSGVPLYERHGIALIASRTDADVEQPLRIIEHRAAMEAAPAEFQAVAAVPAAKIEDAVVGPHGQ